jgi:hypothetical protein
MKFYGIRGLALKLITSYLEGRYQQVSLDNNAHSSNWGLIRHGDSQESILGPLLFLLYINDLPKSINNNAKIVLFADDTSIIVNSPNQIELRTTANKVFQDINRWFTCNLPSLSAYKTHYMQFVTRTSSLLELNIFHGNEKTANSYNTKFLGLTLDNTLSWKVYIDSVVPRLSSACFSMRMVKPLLSQEELKMVYCSYFHSIMSYGIIFWGNSRHSNLIFRLQKKAIRIMTGLRGRESCRKYIFSLSVCD